MPSDPFEAELLMMAEAVASGGHESDSESDVSDDDNCTSLHTVMCNLKSLSATLGGLRHDKRELVPRAGFRL